MAKVLAFTKNNLGRARRPNGRSQEYLRTRAEKLIVRAGVLLEELDDETDRRIGWLLTDCARMLSNESVRRRDPGVS